jgi:hypothetical protein
MAALSEVPATGDQAALLGLMMSTDPQGDKTGALAALEKVANDAALAPVYRDLAVLRRVIVADKDMPLADRRTALQTIAIAGRPYRVLAAEQLGLLLIEEGKTDEAVEAFAALMQDQEATQSLRARARQIIVALGGQLPDAG